MVFNAENIHGLNAVWRDIQTTLMQVGSCCNSYSDRGTSTLAVIMSDFDSLVKELTLKRHMMDSGAREAGIHECKELTKRINIAREAGYKLDEKARQTMMDWHASLLQDKAEADKLSREAEAVSKAHATEIANLAPKLLS